jgi:hypothetical protein
MDERSLWKAQVQAGPDRGARKLRSTLWTSPVDVDQLPVYLRKHWPETRERLLAGSYKPQPVLRVEIEKPDGGVRKLGIPTVVDRFIQQAVLQVLQRQWDPTFSDHSYGFRPGRSAHQAVTKAQQYNIYVRSPRAGERVMEGISNFITRKLKLKVNSEKSAVARPAERKFLGFSFTREESPRLRIAPKAVQRFKQRVRELTRRTRGMAIETMADQLTLYLRGWKNYFGRCQTPSVLQQLEKWYRRRLRSVIWKHSFRRRQRYPCWLELV